MAPGISILKTLLESKNSIKTFFGENEKTPNHDGFFELVNTDTKQPKKQFIVQIKKTDVKTKVIPHEGGKFMPYWLELRTIKFANPQGIVIDYDENIPSQYSEELDKKAYSKSIISTTSGIFPIELFETRMPFYNAIKVFLWQGIMESYKLDKPLHGVMVGNMRCSLF